VRVKVDVDGEERGTDAAAVHDAAREERAGSSAAHAPAVGLAAIAGVVLVAACAASLLVREEPAGTERDVLGVLLMLAALLLLVAIGLAVAAAWPQRSRGLEELARPALAAGEPAERRARLVALAGVETAQCERARRGRLLAAALTVFALSLIPIAAQAAVVAFESGGTEGRDGTDGTDGQDETTVQELAERYAPTIGLHRRERYGPLDPAMFLQTATVRWAQRGRDPQILRPGRQTAAAIGAACDERCATVGPYLSDQLTRPYRRGRARPRRLPVTDGLYLDGDATLRPGQLVPRPSVPIFYEATPAADAASMQITYWAFFPFHRALRQRARGHEGDWEAVTVELDPQRRPTTVRFARPGGARTVAWSDLTARGTHPLVFATAQSHELAARSSGGRRASRRCVRVGRRRVCTLHLRGAALRWEPRGANVQALREQPWYGFGGAWGRVGASNATTGPLGPSRFRPPAAP
jgi:hypothetical protein